MYYFCTYFDHHYLVKGLALLHSLQQHCDAFKLFILCLSDRCYQLLAGLPLENVELIPLERFEEGDYELLEAKKNRSQIEYYFTCTPSWLLYIFRHYPEVDLITYLDSDLYFFSDPQPIFAEISGGSIALIGHRFPPNLKHLEKFGKYNKGWLAFRRDEQGLACLHWYRQQCLEWCYDRVEVNRFADQKYLDFFAGRFGDIIEILHKGANLSAWNIANYRLFLLDDKIAVDGDPLLFFHFQGLKELFPGFYDVGFFPYQVKLTSFMRRHIFLPYINQLRQLEALLATSEVLLDSTTDMRYGSPDLKKNKFISWLQWVKKIIRVLYPTAFIYIKRKIK